MYCADAMRYKVMRKGDALQISPPIRQTSPGGGSRGHTGTELYKSAQRSADELHKVNLQTNLRAAYIRSCCCIAIAPSKDILQDLLLLLLLLLLLFQMHQSFFFPISKCATTAKSG